MVFPAERMAQRAAEWIRADPSVRAGVVYGSVARQEATEDSELGGGVIDQLNRAAPVSGDIDELRRSLLATAELYDWALGRWAQRTGQPNPRSALAGAILARLGQQH
jgi:hypothetical protein